MTTTHTTGPWESRPIGIYVLNAPPSCGVIARIPYTDTKPVVENTGRRPMLKSVGGEDAA